MKKLRSLFLVLALGFGFMLGGRAEGQIVGQQLTFSIICQYNTNYLVITNLQTIIKGANKTNIYTITTNGEILTVLLDSANICKAMAIDLFNTNWTTYQTATLWYEQNLATGNQGLFLREGGTNQWDVAKFFTNSGSIFTNAASLYPYSNYFSATVTNVFTGMNFAPEYLPLGEPISSTEVGIGTNEGTVEITNGAHVSYSSRFGNLAYLSFASSNIAFDLLGYNQSAFVGADAISNNVVYHTNVQEGQIVGAGTFRLNVSTNIYDDSSFLVPPAPVYGVAHGTVFLNAPFYLYYLNVPNAGTNSGP